MTTQIVTSNLCMCQNNSFHLFRSIVFSLYILNDKFFFFFFRTKLIQERIKRILGLDLISIESGIEKFRLTDVHYSDQEHWKFLTEEQNMKINMTQDIPYGEAQLSLICTSRMVSIDTDDF